MEMIWIAVKASKKVGMAVGFQDAITLFGKLGIINPGIPSQNRVGRDTKLVLIINTIRRISQDKRNTFIWELLHQFKAVLLKNTVNVIIRECADHIVIIVFTARIHRDIYRSKS